MKPHGIKPLGIAVVACLLLANLSHACTGITLKSKDGAIVFGRTLEWGAFDLHSRLVVVPRGHEYIATTPDGAPGLAWTANYGAVGLDAVEKDYIVDGRNEKGFP